MTDTFYTSAICVGSNILYRGIENGAKVRKKIPYKPTLCLPTRKASKFKTLQGETLEPRRFDTIRDARDFVKQFTEVQNFKIYGNNRYEYAFIAEKQRGPVNYDSDKISVAVIDIEVGGGEFANQPDKKIRMRKKEQI